MKVLTRHLYLSLLGPFFFCLIAFCSFLLMADLFSSLGDFIQGKAPLGMILAYYKAFIPGLLTLALPMSVLFSSLYSLLRLSRNAELTVMQACGVPLWRIYLPFVILSFVCTGILYVVMLGPGGNAKERRQAVMERIRGNLDWDSVKHGQVYQDRSSGRVWYLQTLNLHRHTAEGLEILQSNAQGFDETKYFANHAEWQSGFWTLHDVHLIHFNDQGVVKGEENLDQLPCPTWTDKPLDMVALQIRPDQLSYQDLQGVIERLSWQGEIALAPYRTQLMYLRTYPLCVIVLTLFALVDGTSHYRRNSAAGVFNAIFVLIVFFLVLHTFIAMGRGDRLSPLVATTFPLILFAVIGALRLAPRFGFYPLRLVFGRS